MPYSRELEWRVRRTRLESFLVFFALTLSERDSLDHSNCSENWLCGP